jgi:hypothetical protein
MLIPKKNRVEIYKYLFKEGVLYAEKDFNKPECQRVSEAQFAWLERTLQQAKGARHVFCFLHHPRWLAQYGDDDGFGDHHHGHGDGAEKAGALPPPPENPGLDLVVQPLVFPIILTPYGLAVVITLSSLVRDLEGSPATLIAILLVIMVLNLLAMIFARPILAVIRPRVLQMLGLILGIIQLALGIGLLFTALEVQALAIQELLR